MKQRKLITREEARPASRQHTSPCSDCPFRRDSLPGWLGGDTPTTFVLMARSDTPYNCHYRDRAECAGLAIFRANVGKSPRDPEVLRLPGDKKLVFGWYNEFIEHHSKGLGQ